MGSRLFGYFFFFEIRLFGYLIICPMECHELRNVGVTCDYCLASFRFA
jgi:hypothetical protein